MNRFWCLTRQALVVLSMAAVLVGTAGAGARSEAGTQTAGRVMPTMTGMRVVDEPVRLTAMVSLHESQVDANALTFMQYLMRETGVQMVFENVPDTNYNEKLNLTFASGTLPDIVYSGATRAFILEQSSIGNILPLNDLVDGYTVNIRRHLSERDDIRGLLTLPDGKIYSLWGVEEYPSSFWLDPYFVNRKWLDNLGLKMPTTVTEFRDVLREFKRRDANGNGNPNDEIPFSWRELGWGGQRIDTFFGAWGVIDSQDDNHVAFRNGKAYLTAVEPGYRQGLQFLHEMYAEGLIDPESFTQDMAQLRAKAQNDQVGSIVFFLPVNVFGAERVKDLAFLGVLAGPDGSRMARQADTVAGFQGPKYLITKSNPNPEVSIRFADVLMDGGEVSLSVTYGPEGHYWQRLPDDKWTLNAGLIPTGVGEVQHRAAVSLFRDIWHVDRVVTARRVPPIERDAWFSQVNATPGLVWQQPLPSFWISAAESAELSRLATDVKTYAKEMRARFIIDGVSEASWSTYVSNMEKIGYRRMLQIYQSASDALSK